MFRYAVLCLCSIQIVFCQQLDKFEGSSCTWQGLKGKCASVYKCQSAILDLKEKNFPPVCSYKGKDPIICCTDCTLVNDTRNYIVNDNLGLMFKTGQKAHDKCLDYLHRLDYPCKIGSKGYLTKDVHGTCRGVGHAVGVSDKQAHDKANVPELPHMALLGSGESEEAAAWSCAGAVISEEYILTAAHCAGDEQKGTNIKYVAVGIINRTDTASWRKYRVSIIIPHPEYKSSSKYHDIALVKTDRPITFDHLVRPACFHQLHHYEKASLPGWGFVKDNTKPQTRAKREDSLPPGNPPPLTPTNTSAIRSYPEQLSNSPPQSSYPGNPLQPSNPPGSPPQQAYYPPGSPPQSPSYLPGSPPSYPPGSPPSYPQGSPPSYPPGSPPSYPSGSPPSYYPGSPPRPPSYPTGSLPQQPSYPPGSPPAYPPGSPPSYQPGSPPSDPPGSPPSYPPGSPPSYPPGSPPQPPQPTQSIISSLGTLGNPPPNYTPGSTGNTPPLSSSAGSPGNPPPLTPGISPSGSPGNPPIYNSSLSAPETPPAHNQPPQTSSKPPLGSPGGMENDRNHVPGENKTEVLQTTLLVIYDELVAALFYPPGDNMATGYNETIQVVYGVTGRKQNDCEGDIDGAPLQDSRRAEGCANRVVGVSSGERSCGEQASSALYTRVHYYVPWLESVVWP